MYTLVAIYKGLTTKSETNRGGLANPATENDKGDTKQILRKGQHFVNRRPIASVADNAP